MNRAAAQRFDVDDTAKFDGRRPDLKPLRIAIDATPLFGPRTGIGGVVSAVSQRLATADEIDLTGYVVSWRAQDYETTLPQGCQALPLRWPARACHRLWRRFDVPRLPGRFDLVHGTNYSVAPAPGAVSLVSVHDLTSWWYPELVDSYSRANPQLLRRALDRGAHVHTGAEAVAAELRAELDVDPDRIHVVVNGFDRLEAGVTERGRARIGAPYILAIGTIEPRKDYIGLIAAMRQVWAEHGDVKLAIVGGDGWGIDEFNEAVKRSGVADRVVRCGYVSEQLKSDLIAGAELLAYPSIYEGFGLPVLEAMDGGLPVVSTDVPAIAEVAGDAAVLVPVREPEALAVAINTVLGDDKLRSGLRARGHERCQMFSWDTAAAEMADLYYRLVSLR